MLVIRTMAPTCYNIPKKNNVRIFVGSFERKRLQFPGVLLGQPIQNLAQMLRTYP
jgi:hypothetical protein